MDQMITFLFKDVSQICNFGWADVQWRQQSDTVLNFSRDRGRLRKKKPVGLFGAQAFLLP
jgi:hypothetical protein